MLDFFEHVRKLRLSILLYIEGLVYLLCSCTKKKTFRPSKKNYSQILAMRLEPGHESFKNWAQPLYYKSFQWFCWYKRFLLKRPWISHILTFEASKKNLHFSVYHIIKGNNVICFVFIFTRQFFFWEIM